MQWPPSAPGRFDATAPLWVTADRGLDSVRPELGVAPQLYQLDCVAYESLLLGMFSILRGDVHENDSEGRDAFPGRPKCAEVCLGYSRDGFHWDRPTHQTFAGISERRGDWNWGNVQPTGNSFVVVGDNLYFYVSGRRGSPEFSDQNTALLNAAYAGCSTGLAILRRDGFASMDAAGEKRTLTTRQVQFGGSRLFVNVDSLQGELQVEILNADGKIMAPFSKENCIPVRSNETRQLITWKDASDLSSLSGRPVRIRFHLTNGELYSFWVSDKTGASNGYVAGGGPGFDSSRDTVGSTSSTANSNRAPLANAGPDQTVRDVDGNGTQRVSLSAGRSTDHDGRVTGFRWLLDGKQIATGETTDVELRVGEHTIVLAAKDDDGAEGLAQVTVTVRPKVDAVPSGAALVLWLKADSLKSVADGEAVSVWRDSSGNGMDCRQEEAGQQPVFVSRAIGNAPAIRFDDHFVVDHSPGMLFTFHKSTIIAVVRPDSGGSIISQAHTSLHVSGKKPGKLTYSSAHPVAGGRFEWPQIRSAKGGRLVAGRGAVCSMVHAGDRPGETALFVNGHRDDDGTAFPYHRTGVTTPFIGCGYLKRSAWKGDLAEIIVYSRALPENERQAVERYLKNKYGIDK